MEKIYVIETFENYHLITFLNDELTLHKASGFLPELQTELLDSNDRNLIFDLKNVRYADSSFLGKLIIIHKQLKASDKHLVLVNSNDDFNDIIQLAQLDKMLVVKPDLEEGISFLN